MSVAEEKAVVLTGNEGQSSDGLMHIISYQRRDRIQRAHHHSALDIGAGISYRRAFSRFSSLQIRKQGRKDHRGVSCLPKTGVN